MQRSERSTRSSRRDVAGISLEKTAMGPPGPQNDTGQFLCIECNETFDTKLQLNSHRQSHVTKKPFVCSHCGRGFHHQVFLQMHERSHENGAPQSQTFLSKTSPSRMISTRSSKAVTPVVADKVLIKATPTKHSPLVNSMFQFRREKIAHPMITPVECVTRLTHGRAPQPYQQNDDQEKKNPFGFRILNYSDTTVHVIDTFGNSIELLTEVFNRYASTEVAEDNSAENLVHSNRSVEQIGTFQKDSAQLNTANPCHEETSKNVLHDSVGFSGSLPLAKAMTTQDGPAVKKDQTSLFQNGDSENNASSKPCQLLQNNGRSPIDPMDSPSKPFKSTVSDTTLSESVPSNDLGGDTVCDEDSGELQDIIHPLLSPGDQMETVETKQNVSSSTTVTQLSEAVATHSLSDNLQNTENATNESNENTDNQLTDNLTGVTINASQGQILNKSTEVHGVSPGSDVVSKASVSPYRNQGTPPAYQEDSLLIAVHNSFLDPNVQLLSKENISPMVEQDKAPEEADQSILDLSLLGDKSNILMDEIHMANVSKAEQGAPSESPFPSGPCSREEPEYTDSSHSLTLNDPMSAVIEVCKQETVKAPATVKSNELVSSESEDDTALLLQNAEKRSIEPDIDMVTDLEDMQSEDKVSEKNKADEGEPAPNLQQTDPGVGENVSCMKKPEVDLMKDIYSLRLPEISDYKPSDLLDQETCSLITPACEQSINESKLESGNHNPGNEILMQSSGLLNWDNTYCHVDTHMEQATELQKDESISDQEPNTLIEKGVVKENVDGDHIPTDQESIVLLMCDFATNKVTSDISFSVEDNLSKKSCKSHLDPGRTEIELMHQSRQTDITGFTELDPQINTDNVTKEFLQEPGQISVPVCSLELMVPGKDKSNQEVVNHQNNEKDSCVVSLSEDCSGTESALLKSDVDHSAHLVILEEDQTSSSSKGQREDSFNPLLIVEQEIFKKNTLPVGDKEPVIASEGPLTIASPNHEECSLEAAPDNPIVVTKAEADLLDTVTVHSNDPEEDVGSKDTFPVQSQDLSQYPHIPATESGENHKPTEISDHATLDRNVAAEESTCSQSNRELESLSVSDNQEMEDETATSNIQVLDAASKVEVLPCERLMDNTLVVGPDKTAAMTESVCPFLDQQNTKLDILQEQLSSPNSKSAQASPEPPQKLLSLGSQCLMCGQKLRSYRGEISSPVCRKCRQSKKKEENLLEEKANLELPPQTQSNAEENVLNLDSLCQIKEEVIKEENADSILKHSEPNQVKTEVETTTKKLYKCHKCEKAFVLPALLAGHVKCHSLPRCLTCGRPMRLRYKVRRVPRNCRVCAQKIRNKKKESFTLNESAEEEDKSDRECLPVSHASLDLECPGNIQQGVQKLKSASSNVMKSKLSTAKLHQTRHLVKKQASLAADSNLEMDGTPKDPNDIRKDTSPKPYKCLQCSMAFKRPIYLAKHVRKHIVSPMQTPFTGLKDSPCDSDDGSDQKSQSEHQIHSNNQNKRQKRVFAKHRMERRQLSAKKLKMCPQSLPFTEPVKLSTEDSSAGTSQILKQEDDTRNMHLTSSMLAKEEISEAPISHQNSCKDEDVLSDSSVNSSETSTSCEKLHVCQHCGKRFQLYRSLHLHVLIHSAVQCESCGCRLRFRKRAGRRAKKCRLCRLQEKEQAMEILLPVPKRKSLSLGKVRASAILPPSKKPTILKSIKGQSLAELKQMSKGMKRLLAKGLIKNPRKQKANLMALHKLAGRKKKVSDLMECEQPDPLLGLNCQETSHAIKLEDASFSDTTEKVLFVSTMKMKKTKGAVQNKKEINTAETTVQVVDHTSLMPLIDEKTYQCPVCAQNFTKQDLLFTHLQSHPEELPFTCPQCPHRFHKKQDLKTHRLTHVKARPYSCPDCNKCFTQINHLNMHRRVHMGIRPYSCPDCPSSFRHKVSLLVHRCSHAKVLPIELKPYQCIYCTKRFLRSDHLEIHQRIHTGECPFQCQDCDKTFPSKARLSVHSRVHSGVRPHTCPTCERSFIHKANLERHLQKHTGEPAFSCLKCDVRFPSLVMLAQHKHTHREEEVFSCVHCAKRFLYKKSLFKHQNVCQSIKKVKLRDGQASGVKRKRRLKELQGTAELGIKKKKPKLLKKNLTGAKREKLDKHMKIKKIKKEKVTTEEEQETPQENQQIEEGGTDKGKKKQSEGKPIKVKKIKKKTMTEEALEQTPKESLPEGEGPSEKGKKKQVEGKPIKVKKIKKAKITTEEESGQDSLKSLKTEDRGTTKGKKKQMMEKAIKVKKITKKDPVEEEQEQDPPKESLKSSDNGTDKVKKKQTDGKPQKTVHGKQDKITGIVKVKKEKAQKVGGKLKLRKEEGAKSKDKQNEGAKQAEEKSKKKSKLGVKRGPYKKKIKITALGEKKKIVQVKVKGVQVKLKPGPKKKQLLKEKKEKG
ncbi:uncharacterized protein LOC134609272 [Pelobates fuscus]|uniref:uncharacterized protein LOC134609272 n=1 Tax=Pelobates fuscus TaxID=191477 RepID=UPI002FE44B2D